MPLTGWNADSGKVSVPGVNFPTRGGSVTSIQRMSGRSYTTEWGSGWKWMSPVRRTRRPGGNRRSSRWRQLKVTVNEVPVQPGFALGSYAAFKQYPDGAMVMGDLVLTDPEVNAVMQGLLTAASKCQRCTTT